MTKASLLSFRELEVYGSNRNARSALTCRHNFLGPGSPGPVV